MRISVGSANETTFLFFPPCDGCRDLGGVRRNQTLQTHSKLTLTLSSLWKMERHLKQLYRNMRRFPLFLHPTLILNLNHLQLLWWQEIWPCPFPSSQLSYVWQSVLEASWFMSSHSPHSNPDVCLCGEGRVGRSLVS